MWGIVLCFAERIVGGYKYAETVDTEILVPGIQIMLVLWAQGGKCNHYRWRKIWNQFCH